MTTFHQSDFIQVRDLFTELHILTNYVRFPDNISDGYGMPIGDAWSIRKVALIYSTYAWQQIAKQWLHVIATKWYIL